MFCLVCVCVSHRQLSWTVMYDVSVHALTCTRNFFRFWNNYVLFRLRLEHWRRPEIELWGFVRGDSSALKGEKSCACFRMHGTITVHVHNESGDDGDDDENIIYMTRRALCNQTSLTFHLIFHDEFKRAIPKEKRQRRKNKKSFAYTACKCRARTRDICALCVLSHRTRHIGMHRSVYGNCKRSFAISAPSRRREEKKTMCRSIGQI